MSTQAITFKSLKIGDTFDFIGPERMYVTFSNTCEKISARGYRWKNPIRCEQSPDEYLKTRVGSINVIVYHVNENQL